MDSITNSGLGNAERVRRVQGSDQCVGGKIAEGAGRRMDHAGWNSMAGEQRPRSSRDDPGVIW